ncbi:gliding motility-associated C-terminal domain-containing protein [Hanstruepera marina]|uniref:gliding motility-associated C-terminal domain-containing protein n=1 Tax=Hanstruepera marina TaxID=2873265 RepID=UPI001CA747E8|nr:gliding motility-associated C-terminal domain-containing protein [Hanstruepera marina]
MLKQTLLQLFAFLSLLVCYSQSTDLAISVEAQDLDGSDISQAHIYEEFQYLVTITNSGNAVENAFFSQTINQNVSVLSFISQNPVGGTSLITDLSISGNEITGTIASFPASSSIEIKVVVKAPENIGGIATSVNISPPDNITDTNPSNNVSIISIDITDVAIDFTIFQEQVSPPQGTAISAWNDSVTYHFTITNNSAISFSLNAFRHHLSLNSPLSYGSAYVELISVMCIESTNGTACIEDLDFTPGLQLIDSTSPEPLFEFTESHDITSNGTLTLELIYKYHEPECATEIGIIETLSSGAIEINHDNESSNTSNEIITELLTSDFCQETDVCIDTVQIDPIFGTPINYNQIITLETTVCNNGPLDADVLVSLRNYTVDLIWEIQSITCIAGSSTMPCNDINFANAGQYWVSNTFNMPVGEILVIHTELKFLEPECSPNSDPEYGNMRSNITILSNGITDSDLNNNNDADIVQLPTAELCDIVDLEIIKTQISPELPEGSTEDQTTSWGPITYQITASNLSPDDTFIELIDFMPLVDISTATAVLESVSCVSSTGNATCQDLQHTNIGVELDGVSDNDEDTPDVFWEIILDDNWLLPGNSSITFEVVINWIPECSFDVIPTINNVSLYPDSSFIDTVEGNNNSSVTTYFAPCIDLVVQTFPEFPTVLANQSFNWIVDITNSGTSVSAQDVTFENLLGSEFTLNGIPSCQTTFGNADCITLFDIDGNFISGNISNMEEGSTIRIIIPVEAPSYGGAFTNTAEAIPSPQNNEELTPETNISISSVQVLAPTLEKSFNPDIIFTNEISTLTFTIFNPNINTPETDVAFIDNLPNGLILTSSPEWVSSNGSSGNFLGDIGNNFVGIENLNIPIGVSSCSFSVDVTSSEPGIFVNSTSNFTNQNNIDTSQVYAELEVLQNPNEGLNCVKIPQVFTPNNDGINDYFNIECLEDFQSNKLLIYNRYGALLFEAENYTNDWAGKPNRGFIHDKNKPLPVGTYYYILTLENEKPIIGWVYLNY